MTRIDYSDASTHCFRTDHNIARLLNARREKAHEKHGDNSIESVNCDDPAWLAILTEEVGEVAHALTYDSNSDPTALASELLDVAAVAVAWYDALRVAGLVERDPSVWLAS